MSVYSPELCPEASLEASLRAENQRLLEENRSLLARIENLEFALAESEIRAGSDALTGLFNRRVIEGLLEKALGSVNRGNPIAVALMDIDFFKGINDTYGHLQGDQVLRHFAEMLNLNLRPIDHAGRWGGEEFLLVLPIDDHTNPGNVANVMNRILASAHTINRSTGISGEHIPVTVSIGCLIVRSATVLDRSAVLAQADDLLYSSKTHGRDRVTISVKW